MERLKLKNNKKRESRFLLLRLPVSVTKMRKFKVAGTKGVCNHVFSMSKSFTFQYFMAMMQGIPNRPFYSCVLRYQAFEGK